MGSSVEAEAGVRLLLVTVDEDVKQDLAVQELGAGAIHIRSGWSGAALKELVVGLHSQIEHLKLVIAKLRRSQF